MKRPGYQVCLLLGSNVRPETNLPLAVARLRRELTVLQASSVWESPPVGGGGPDYLNAALLAVSHTGVLSLKQGTLLPLEARLGRVRTSDKNSPRPIDLDIILFDGQVLDPTLWQYAHRAVPVSEVLPGLRSEDGETLKDMAFRLAAVQSLRLRTDVAL
ncbi:MAG TPA: 2-amino-4-hydroxy-6-hydroxymethyldihydropteridine diphosphokinase [Anaerolineales bacterium]|nr:2-amino-4-hydroxy-6-hydroxymethyldihydropteridine diphosphokinase [Anaerolineales bacterium]